MRVLPPRDYIAATESIAEVIEVAPGTVKSRLSRARRNLERRIAELSEQGGASASTLHDADMERSFSLLSAEVGTAEPSPDDA